MSWGCFTKFQTETTPLTCSDTTGLSHYSHETNFPGTLNENTHSNKKLHYLIPQLKLNVNIPVLGDRKRQSCSFYVHGCLVVERLSDFDHSRVHELRGAEGLSVRCGDTKLWDKGKE